MEEEKEEEEQKTGEAPKESAETVEEAKAEVEEETEEVSEKEEIPEKEEEVVEEEAVEAEGEEIPAPVEEEEAKPPPREEKVEEEEIVEERIYTIPLGKVWIVPPNKRASRAMRMIRSFVTKHMKLEARGEKEEEEEPKRLIISNDVNERVWMRGIEKPPRKIRIRAAKDKEGNVTVYLAEGD
ncbi:MAG: 50S ribosomal protein L31e [Candidatus Bathyarchaeota archaeon]|nr:50S ribosomal protein L31e [Candidatus Bathyarchaeota archaeon]